MKHIPMIVAVLVSLSACAQLPKIQMPTASDTIPSHLECRALFPQGRWQLHHAIEATIPGGGKTLLTGVTVMSSRNRSIDFALMSVEGFVIFSGRFDGDLTIDRAISPFDRPGFAQGLMDDLMLLFFTPRGLLCMTGQVAQQNRICRYCLPDQTTDIVVTPDPVWQIRQYSSRKRLSRSIDADDIVKINNTPFARKLILKNHGLLGYRLVLKLLEAIALNDERNVPQ
jgi:hypothetical protein